MARLLSRFFLAWAACTLLVVLSLLAGGAEAQFGSKWLSKKAKKEATDFESSKQAAVTGATDTPGAVNEDEVMAALQAMQEEWGEMDFEEIIRGTIVAVRDFAQDMLGKAKAGDSKGMLRLYEELPEEMKSMPELADLPALLEEASSSGQLEEQLQGMVDAANSMLEEMGQAGGLFGQPSMEDMQEVIKALSDPEYLAEQMKILMDDPEMAQAIRESMGDVSDDEIARLMDPVALQAEIDRLMQDPEMKEMMANPEKFLDSLYGEIGDAEAPTQVGSKDGSAWTAAQRKARAAR